MFLLWKEIWNEFYVKLTNTDLKHQVTNFTANNLIRLPKYNFYIYVSITKLVKLMQRIFICCFY